MQLLALLFLHHVGDVWGQPSWLIEAKKKHLWAIYEHCAVWTGLVSLGLYLFDNLALWKIAFLFIVHFLIDTFFYRILPKLRGEEKQYYWVYYDQILHYLQVLVVIYL